MAHPPILLFDFDGCVITQKSLEYAALVHLKKNFYNWRNIESLRLIDIARLFKLIQRTKLRLSSMFTEYSSITFRVDGKEFYFL